MVAIIIELISGATSLDVQKLSALGVSVSATQGNMIHAKAPEENIMQIQNLPNVKKVYLAGEVGVM